MQRGEPNRNMFSTKQLEQLRRRNSTQEIDEVSLKKALKCIQLLGQNLGSDKR